MAGLRVAICSYNMLGMQMYQINQFLEIHSKKLKTQHHLATSRSQMRMGAKPPYPMESTTVTGGSTVLPIHLVRESLYIKLK